MKVASLEPAGRYFEECHTEAFLLRTLECKEAGGEVSQIPQRVPLCKKDIPPDVHPKSSNKIKDDRAAERKKGDIDEVQSDFARRNIKAFAQVGANTKRIHFYKTPEGVHGFCLFVLQFIKIFCRILMLFFCLPAIL